MEIACAAYDDPRLVDRTDADQSARPARSLFFALSQQPVQDESRDLPACSFALVATRWELASFVGCCRRFASTVCPNQRCIHCRAASGCRSGRELGWLRRTPHVHVGASRGSSRDGAGGRQFRLPAARCATDQDRSGLAALNDRKLLLCWLSDLQRGVRERLHSGCVYRIGQDISGNPYVPAAVCSSGSSSHLRGGFLRAGVHEDRLDGVAALV